MSDELEIGAETKWGKVSAVGWIGERYYWLVDKCGDVTMLPESVVKEAQEKSE